jgi:hypothetical protein
MKADNIKRKQIQMSTYKIYASNNDTPLTTRQLRVLNTDLSNQVFNSTQKIEIGESGDNSQNNMIRAMGVCILPKLRTEYFNIDDLAVFNELFRIKTLNDYEPFVGFAYTSGYIEKEQNKVNAGIKIMPAYLSICNIELLVNLPVTIETMKQCKYNKQTIEYTKTLMHRLNFCVSSLSQGINGGTYIHLYHDTPYMKYSQYNVNIQTMPSTKTYFVMTIADFLNCVYEPTNEHKEDLDTTNEHKDDLDTTNEPRLTDKILVNTGMSNQKVSTLENDVLNVVIRIDKDVASNSQNLEIRLSDLTAFFVFDPYNYDRDLMMSYATIGQHSAASEGYFNVCSIPLDINNAHLRELKIQLLRELNQLYPECVINELSDMPNDAKQIRKLKYLEILESHSKVLSKFDASLNK